MAFPDPLVLKNVAAANVNYTRRNPIPNGNRYVDVVSTPALTDYVTIRSIPQGAKTQYGAGTRNIVTFARERKDTDDNMHPAVLSVSLFRPFATDITDADLDELFARWVEFRIAASGDYLSRFRRGEF